jgi:hypothetical protein
MFFLQLRFSNVTLKCRSLVNVALIPLVPPYVSVSALCTRTVFAYKGDTQGASEVGKIDIRGAVNGDHISRRAVDMQLTTCIVFKRGADRCMSAGFQVVEVIATIGRFDISQSVWRHDSKERFGPETVSGTKIDPKSIPSGRCGLINEQCKSLPNHSTWSASNQDN